MVGSSVGLWLGIGVGSTVGECVVGASVGGGTQGAEVTPGDSVPAVPEKCLVLGFLGSFRVST